MTEPTGSPTGALEKALNEKTVSDLKALCRHYKIRGYSGKTKAELITLMMEHSAFQEEAIEHNPQDADTFFNRGVAYYNQGKLDLAIADFDRAVEINPQDADAFYNRGNTHHAQGKFDLAIADYSRAANSSKSGPSKICVSWPATWRSRVAPA